MAMSGYLPISIYQRMDFLPRAADQIVNHLDVMKEMTGGLFNPKVIIRTTVGSHSPLNVGIQHNKDLTEGFAAMVGFPVIRVSSAKEVKEAYAKARTIDSSIMIVELQDLYGD
jgi:pyruvate/2-oxoglutarate/acetoin dehydrogenase E1 component